MSNKQHAFSAPLTLLKELLTAKALSLEHKSLELKLWK